MSPSTAAFLAGGIARETERVRIEALIKRHKGNGRRVAKALCVGYRTVWRVLELYGLSETMKAARTAHFWSQQSREAPEPKVSLVSPTQSVFGSAIHPNQGVE